ncbi:hypothetical protein SAMN05444266_109351 [Chitinophaga jiangningensis]|uniref:DUF3999 domain-containing protein n=1 Tax=Chitinophaga jiangningensis TaxID=1419482 RepID=A0A1M7KIN4_9BACT|nr:hypothetical protein [Chitinophaga jiangningensis]SHM65227.1 hypothetical protein SAMN05444266_109351 [Chitinophaga jiangningensis]
MSKYLRIIIGLLLAGSVNGQQQPLPFTWEAPLPKVAATGFYNIALSPSVVAQLNYPHLSNFRVMKGEEVSPFLVKKQDRTYDESSFVPLEIAGRTTAGKHTVITIHNTAGVQLDQLYLLYNNTRVIKHMRIDGSDDKVKWYAVNSEFTFDPNGGVQTNDPTIAAMGISLPVSGYPWLAVVIDDSLTSPVMIKSVGYYKNITRPAAFTELPDPLLKQDTDHKTHTTQVTLQAKESYLVGKLTFDIKSPAFYHRQVYLQQKIVGERRNAAPAMRTLASFYLSSDQPAAVVLDEPVQAKELYLQIENEDNPPLEIIAVHAWQPSIWLTVYLEKDQPYFIKGAAGMEAGRYDLDYFSKDIPAHLAVLQPGTVKLLDTPAQEKTKSVFNSDWWIWAGIIVIVLLLAFVARSVLKDMNREETVQ